MSECTKVVVKLGAWAVVGLITLAAVLALCAGRTGDYYILSEVSQAMLLSARQCAAVFGVAALATQYFRRDI